MRRWYYESIFTKGIYSSLFVLVLNGAQNPTCLLSDQRHLVLEIREVYRWDTFIFSKEAEKSARSPFRVLVP